MSRKAGKSRRREKERLKHAPADEGVTSSAAEMALATIAGSSYELTEVGQPAPKLLARAKRKAKVQSAAEPMRPKPIEPLPAPGAMAQADLAMAAADAAARAAEKSVADSSKASWAARLGDGGLR